MTINLSLPVTHEMKPKITVVGVGGAGGNAVNNMIMSHLEGVEFVGCNTDAQSLSACLTERRIQLGGAITHGLGAGARPEVGRAAAEESLDDILDQLSGSHMVFITAGMGGGTGTGAAPVIARAVRDQGILTVGVVTKPFHFEGAHRMRLAEAGLTELQQYVDTLIVIPNQNLFRLANERTTFGDAFRMADQVLHMGVRGVTDLMVMPGLINLDFADIRTVMSEMGKAMMGTGEAEGERRAIDAAEAAISNPLLDDVSMRGAHGVLINITGGLDMTLFEVDAAANRIREEVDGNANIIFGSTFDNSMEGRMRVSVVATGIDAPAQAGIRVEQAQAAPPPPVTTVRSFVGSLRFPTQPQRAHPTPQAPAPVPQMRHPAEHSPAAGLRIAQGPEGYPTPPASNAPLAPTISARSDQGGQTASEDYLAAAIGRASEQHQARSGGLFDRMKELAFTRHAPAMRPMREVGEPTEREPEAVGAERHAARPSPRDEHGDIPSFLRRERVFS